MAFVNEAVTVECKNKEGEYYVTEACDSYQHIFTLQSKKIYFTLPNFANDHTISIEVKYDHSDRSDIVQCIKKCEPFFRIDESTGSFMVKGCNYSKCNITNIIDDGAMKIPISFMCLTSHHKRQGIFYKLIFSIVSTNEQSDQILGSFLVKVSVNPTRDFINFTSGKKRKLSEREDDPANIDIKMSSYVVCPRSDDAKSKLIEYVKSNGGKVQELQPGRFL